MVQTQMSQFLPSFVTHHPDSEFGHFKRLLKAFLFGETAAHSDTVISMCRV